MKRYISLSLVVVLFLLAVLPVGAEPSPDGEYVARVIHAEPATFEVKPIQPTVYLPNPKH